MIRMPVQSSRIASIGYDLQTKTLEIEFKSRKPTSYPNRVYQYFDVPEKIYMAFMALPDKGHYFEHVIKNVYDYKEIANEEINKSAMD